MTCTDLAQTVLPTIMVVQICRHQTTDKQNLVMNFSEGHSHTAPYARSA